MYPSPISGRHQPGSATSRITSAPDKKTLVATGPRGPNLRDFPSHLPRGGTLKVPTHAGLLSCWFWVGRAASFKFKLLTLGRWAGGQATDNASAQKAGRPWLLFRRPESRGRAPGAAPVPLPPPLAAVLWWGLASAHPRILHGPSKKKVRGVQSGAAHATAVPTRSPPAPPPCAPRSPLRGCLKFTVTAGAWYLVNAPDLAGLSVRRLLRCALKLCTKMDRFPSACGTVGEAPAHSSHD